MESLADQTWDAIICGTGLQQSLLALALSRSGKQVLHLDPNEYYGGREAALTLDEAEAWAAGTQAGEDGSPVFSDAVVTRSSDAVPGSSRAYALSLSPFIIHARSALISQLVSSRAYRQLEFLAVGTFYVFRPAQGPNGQAELLPIPSTREAIFATDAIQPRPKRALMKFLKFVLDRSSPENEAKWRHRASEPLAPFLEQDFKLDAELRTLILSLTLALDDTITVEQGIAAIERHLTSMGTFGPGFAAVYPKYGGGSEVAQVGCRACAVGGGVYMLGTGASATRPLVDQPDGARHEVTLTEGGITLKTRVLVQEGAHGSPSHARVARLVAVIDAPLAPLFDPVAEDTPNPGVAVIAMPPGSVKDADGIPSTHPLHAFAHSSETGECPTGQSVLYLTTLASPTSSSLLEAALNSLLAALPSKDGTLPSPVWQMRYEQAAPNDSTGASNDSESGLFTFAPAAPELAFKDTLLEPVKDAWRTVLGTEVTPEMEEAYLKFEDREGVADDDES